MGCEKLKKCVTLHFFILNICRNKNFIYLCTRKRKQCNNAEVAQLVEHNLAKVRVAGSSPVFRSSLKRKGCSNGGIGRHEGLKILWPLRLCGFKSRFEYYSCILKSSISNELMELLLYSWRCYLYAVSYAIRITFACIDGQFSLCCCRSLIFP